MLTSRARTQTVPFSISLLALGPLCGCAGPATPLGAVWALHPQQTNTLVLSARPEGPGEIQDVDLMTAPAEASAEVPAEPQPLAAAPPASGVAAAPPAFSPLPSGVPAGGMKVTVAASPAAAHQVAKRVARKAASRAIASLRDTVLEYTSDVPDPTLRFNPPRQVLHGPRTIQVVIEDPRGIREGHDFKVRYGGHDVTTSFLMQARRARSPDGKRVTFEVPAIRLTASAEHLIEMGYRNPAGRQVVARYPAPVCRAFAARGIHRTDDFRPGDELLRAIETVSRQTGFSPAFTAALIAQESAFNPRSVSFARALGLTQVTPIAEEEIAGIFKDRRDWPRYPGLNGLPAPMVKLMVMTGEVNSQNEWRLNPERSIRGGLAFAQQLADRWLDSEGFSKIRWTQGATDLEATDAEVARTRLILASYNSGYARVLGAIHRNGAAWLTAPELREARKYVNRIFSYCDSFGTDFNQGEI